MKARLGENVEIILYKPVRKVDYMRQKLTLIMTMRETLEMLGRSGRSHQLRS